MRNTYRLKVSLGDLIHKLMITIRAKLMIQIDLIELEIEHLPDFTAENEFTFHELLTNDSKHIDPKIKEIVRHINDELFSFSVIHSDHSVGINGDVKFNKYGLLEIIDQGQSYHLNICYQQNYVVNALTLSLVISYFVWNQMIKHRRNVKFARYMLQRLNLAYSLMLNDSDEIVNSHIFTQFKLHTPRH